jgi:glycosyltransferase involved in cell wall biosynthesis
MENAALGKSNTGYREGLVSVIMPAYNSGAYITGAVKSVLSQSYENLELIISDDCSKDNTIDAATKASGGDQRVKIITSEKNTGVSGARNRALESAAGQYIAFLDSDDIWNHDKLDKQIKSIKTGGYGLSYGSYGFMNESGDVFNSRIAKINIKAGYKSLLKDNFIGMLTVLIDREKTGTFRFSDDRHEDLILWLKFAKMGIAMGGLNESLAYYRVSGSSLSGNKLKAALWRWRVYRKIEKLNIFESIWYMVNYIFNSIRKRVKHG